MSAPTLAVGTATYTRHDAHTRHVLDDYRERLRKRTDLELLAAAYRAETLPRGWVADEIRDIVDTEVQRRRTTREGFAEWWTATVAEVAR